MEAEAFVRQVVVVVVVHAGRIVVAIDVRRLSIVSSWWDISTINQTDIRF
jgi:hypothetical protein